MLFAQLRRILFNMKNKKIINKLLGVFGFTK